MSSPLRASPSRCAGLTLIEMIVSLVLVGIMSSITAVFLQVPMQSYMVSRQRIDLSDGVELSMRHMEQEIRQALPNSVRPPFTIGTITYIEFLATRGSGRYRSVAGGAPACAGGNNFQTGGDTCFNSLGRLSLATPVQVNNDYVVINNVGPSSPTADAYRNNAANGPNKARITGFTLGATASSESQVRFANTAFAANSPSLMFHIVSGPVMYACDRTARQLVRFSGYPIRLAQAAPPANATRSVIASNLLDCTPRYTASTTALMQGVLSVELVLDSTVPGQVAEVTNFVVHVPVSKTP